MGKSGLICISHLRWDFVWQRPQQLLSRLSKHYPIFFVEEPIASPELAQPELRTYTWDGEDGEHVKVIQLFHPTGHHHWIGHGDPLTQATYTQHLQNYLAEQGVEDPLIWLYTPMAAPFVEPLQPDLLIYDVMDQLSAFRGAPVDLIEQDNAVLRSANIVFTGGVSLYRDKLTYNTNTYLFPSGVDIAHFKQASTGDLPRPDDIARLSQPILGYFGVIDERIDVALLAHVAQQHPEWNLVMLGPVLKIGPHELPQAPNIYYLGMKSYDELPAYLAHFDVALVPFALNEATRYVSPTKVLEYMAAHKPIISTPIHDVIELYGSVVHIGHNPQAFVQQIEQVLAASAKSAQQRPQEDELLHRNTWDAIANEMAQIIEAALQDTLHQRETV